MSGGGVGVLTLVVDLFTIDLRLGKACTRTEVQWPRLICTVEESEKMKPPRDSDDLG